MMPSKTNRCMIIFKSATSDDFLMTNGGYVQTTLSTENNSNSLCICFSFL